MHFKHEQPQVLSPDSHVTIDTFCQNAGRSQHVFSLGTFEFDDTIVGTRLDQRSY